MKKTILILLACALFHASAALAAVNVNTADASSLASLDGIGAVKAKAIVAYREEHGEFNALEGLTNVSGIGSKTVDHLSDAATVGSDG